MRGADGSVRPVVATWRFRAQPHREPGRWEEAAFRTALRDALRSGHGLGADVEIGLTSGPEGELTIRTCEPASARWFARVVSPIYPLHQWVVAEGGAPLARPGGSGWYARRARAWPEPLATDDSTSAVDLWASTVSALPAGVRLAVRLHRVLSPLPRAWGLAPIEPLPTPATSGRWAHRGVRPAGEAAPGGTAPSHPLFWRVSVAVGAAATSAASRGGPDLRLALTSTPRTPRGNGLVFRPGRSPGWARAFGPESFLVSLEEAVSFWPSPACPAAPERRSSSEAGPILPLGRTRAGAVVGTPIEEHQGRHVAVLGETGMGKSSLLLALTRRASVDAGAIVFDPLGETVRAVRGELGPSAARRSLWLAPDSPAVGLNALEGIGCGEQGDPVRSERRLNDLVHALRRVRSGRYTESGYWGPRLEEMVTRAIRAASAFPDGTLLDAHTLLATSTRLGRALPPEAREPVRELADRIRDRPEDADGARRLLHEVVRSPVLVRMLCSARPTLSTRDLVAPGRVVLISGDAALVGESTARYLLSVLLALVWSELLARPDSAKTYVVLDEAQWFSHDSLAEMLRLGRRKNVHVILATQAVGSLPESVGEAVWTNVSDFVAFRGSPEEARDLSRAAPGISPEAVLSLPRGEAVVLLGKGETVRWVRAARRPSHLPGPSSTLGTGEDGGAREPPTPPNPAPDHGAGATDGRSSLDVVWEEIARSAAAAEGEDTVRLELDELRRRVDPEGSLVRQAGSLLSRSGALLRVERTGTGTRWIVDRRRLASSTRPPDGSPPAVEDSDAPQPS